MSKVAAVSAFFIVFLSVIGVNYWLLERKRRSQENDYEMQSFQVDVSEVEFRVTRALGYSAADVDSIVENAGIASQENREKGIWEDIEL
ncbi:hypothetical protein ACEPAG_4259 [Sanghuangporus baumii]